MKDADVGSHCSSSTTVSPNMDTAGGRAHGWQSCLVFQRGAVGGRPLRFRKLSSSNLAAESHEHIFGLRVPSSDVVTDSAETDHDIAVVDFNETQTVVVEFNSVEFVQSSETNTYEPCDPPRNVKNAECDQCPAACYDCCVATCLELLMSRGLSTSIVVHGGGSPSSSDARDAFVIGTPSGYGLLPLTLRNVFDHPLASRDTCRVSASFVALTQNSIVDLSDLQRRQLQIDLEGFEGQGGAHAVLSNDKRTLAKDIDDAFETLDIGLDSLDKALELGFLSSRDACTLMFSLYVHHAPNDDSVEGGQKTSVEEEAESDTSAPPFEAVLRFISTGNDPHLSRWFEEMIVEAAKHRKSHNLSSVTRREGAHYTPTISPSSPSSPHDLLSVDDVGLPFFVPTPFHHHTATMLLPLLCSGDVSAAIVFLQSIPPQELGHGMNPELTLALNLTVRAAESAPLLITYPRRTPSSKPLLPIGEEVREPTTAAVADSALPLGWDVQTTDDGRVFYVDHIHKRTSWHHPLSPEGLRERDDAVASAVVGSDGNGGTDRGEEGLVSSEPAGGMMRHSRSAEWIFGEDDEYVFPDDAQPITATGGPTVAATDISLVVMGPSDNDAPRMVVVAEAHADIIGDLVKQHQLEMSTFESPQVSTTSFLASAESPSTTVNESVDDVQRGTAIAAYVHDATVGESSSPASEAAVTLYLCRPTSREAKVDSLLDELEALMKRSIQSELDLKATRIEADSYAAKCKQLQATLSHIAKSLNHSEVEHVWDGDVASTDAGELMAKQINEIVRQRDEATVTVSSLQALLKGPEVIDEASQTTPLLPQESNAATISVAVAEEMVMKSKLMLDQRHKEIVAKLCDMQKDVIRKIYADCDQLLVAERRRSNELEAKLKAFVAEKSVAHHHVPVPRPTTVRQAIFIEPSPAQSMSRGGSPVASQPHRQPSHVQTTSASLSHAADVSALDMIALTTTWQEPAANMLPLRRRSSSGSPSDAIKDVHQHHHHENALDDDASPFRTDALRKVTRYRQLQADRRNAGPSVPDQPARTIRDPFTRPKSAADLLRERQLNIQMFMRTAESAEFGMMGPALRDELMRRKADVPHSSASPKLIVGRGSSSTHDRCLPKASHLVVPNTRSNTTRTHEPDPHYFVEERPFVAGTKKN